MEEVAPKEGYHLSTPEQVVRRQKLRGDEIPKVHRTRSLDTGEG
jgi:hypothetical protein